MADNRLDQVQCWVEQRSAHEQASLLAFLAFRMSRRVTSTSSSVLRVSSGALEAWEDVFRLGEDIAAGDVLASETLTTTVQAMRR